jgi:hypothetical protein
MNNNKEININSITDNLEFLVALIIALSPTAIVVFLVFNPKYFNYLGI